MTYWALDVVFLAIAAVTGIAALAVRVRRRRRERLRAGHRARQPLAAWIVSAAVLLGMTAIFDNVMIGIGLVGYDASKISGVFVGIAPLEDFSYAVAAVVLLPSLWVLLGARSAKSRTEGS
jgi:lycopene cyclase domain-containing protein